MKKILITCCLILATCSLFAQYQEIQNGESGYSTRTKLNTMFQQLFARTSAVGDSIELYLPEFLTDLDSMGFSLDTMQVRHLKEAIEAWSINEFQVLSINGDTIFLSNGNYVVLPENGISPEDTTGLYHSNRTVLDATTASFTTTAQSNYNSAVSHISADHDTSATNELQILSFSGDTLYLSNGGYVYLGAYANPSLTAYLRKEDSALYAPLFRLDTVKANIRSEIPDVSGFLETETDPVFALYPKIPKDSTLILLKADSALYKSKWSAEKQLADSAATLRALVPLNPVLGSGTANYIPKFSDSNTLTDSPIRTSADSVGIGVTPTAKFHVRGSSGMDIAKIENSNTGGGADGLRISSGGTGSGDIPLLVETYTGADKLMLQGNGILTLPGYGSGSITGTAAYYAAFDANGKLIEVSGSGGSGMTDPMTNAGDIIIRNGSNATTRLGIGTDGQVMTVSGGIPSWQTSGSSIWSYDGLMGAYKTASEYPLSLLDGQGLYWYGSFPSTLEMAFWESSSGVYSLQAQGYNAVLSARTNGTMDLFGNNFKAVKTGTAKNDTIPTMGWVEDKISSSGGGDMLKSTYDSDNNTRVDNAETVSDGTNTTSAANVKAAYDDRNKWDGGSTGLTAATGRTSLGGTTVGSNLFTLTNPSAIRFLRLNADNTVSALSDSDFRTAIGAGSGSMVYPGAGISISTGSAWGTSITDNSANWNTAHTDRLKWDGGSTGLTAATGRTSLGGTTIGQAMFTSTNPGAITFGRANADNTFSWLSAADFKTALSLGSVENTALSTWAGTTNITTLGTVAAGTWSGTAIGATKGGTGQTTYTTGDILYSNGTNALAKLGIGSTNQVLTVVGGVPAWANAAAGFSDPMTTRGDVIYRNSSNATARLGLGTSGQVLSSNGSDVVWATPAGGGNVSNSGTPTSGQYGRWVNATTVEGVAASTVKTDLSLGNVENTALSTWAGTTNITTLGTVATGTWSGTAIGATKGGTGQTAYTTGDILYSNGTNALAKLGIGSTNQVLTVVGGVPAWAANYSFNVAINGISVNTVDNGERIDFRPGNAFQFDVTGDGEDVVGNVNLSLLTKDATATENDSIPWIDNSAGQKKMAISTLMALGADNSATNEIQDLSLSGNTLSLSGDGTSVNLSGYLDNTDAQNVNYTPSTRAVAISGGTGFTMPLFSTSSTDAGLVPGGTSISTKFLRGDGTWQDAPSGGATNIDGLTDAKTDTRSIFLGSNAGFNDDGNNFNTAVGVNAFDSNTSGMYNTVMGAEAGSGITTGNWNTLYGYLTGIDITTGYDNIILGGSSQIESATDTSSIVIGTGVIGMGSKTTLIGNYDTENTYILGKQPFIKPAANWIPIDYKARQSLTPAASITMDFRLGSKASFTLSAATTITITNLPDGQDGVITVTQNGSTAYTCVLAGSTGYTTTRKFGSNAAVSSTLSKKTKIVYERVNDELQYSYVYEN